LKEVYNSVIIVNGRKKNIMSMHRVEFDYYLPEGGIMELDIDPTASQAVKEYIAEREIKESFPDAMDIEIISIEEV